MTFQRPKIPKIGLSSSCINNCTRSSTRNSNPVAVNTNESSSKCYTSRYFRALPPYDTAPEKQTSSNSSANTILITPEAGLPDSDVASPNRQYPHQSSRSALAGVPMSHPAGGCVPNFSARMSFRLSRECWYRMAVSTSVCPAASMSSLTVALPQ